MNIEKIIEKVTTETIIQLKKSNLLKENKKSTFQKTEELLRNYNTYLSAAEKKSKKRVKTQKLINLIDEALKTIEHDPYYSVIEMIYFEHKTREEIAEFYDCEVRTITRNKTRLINKLKLILFSDESIEEILKS